MTNAGRDYWSGVLDAGGVTEIPRWTPHPVAGLGRHDAIIPETLLLGLQRRADELDVTPSSVLLAAHARVLASLSGEREVTTGYVARTGDLPLPCRLTVGPGSWRELLLQARRVESELVAHRDFPVDDLRRERGLPRSFETVLDPGGDGGGLDEGVLLRVGISRPNGQLALRSIFRTDAFDTNAVGRILGYHVTALELAAADPHADHGQSLLSAAERRFQIDGLAGSRRALPDLRAHELFERRVAAHPDAVAAVHGERRWTYGELNSRANRLGRALLARGLRREEVVAVVTERNLDWMACVLAVFKAGGVYLPIEPHFPADRIAKMLSRAECRFVLTESGSTATLDRALEAVPGVPPLLVDALYEEHQETGDLGVDVVPGQAAYIYFTSGSTGEPKGAMCEHAGLVNHLYAKIDDLEIAEGRVVAQIAPQCFDISLWQLVSALLVGGRTLIIEQEVILDVERFVRKIVEGRVAVMQVVPSYLEVVLSYLEQNGRELPDLRYVSVTGEAVTKELCQRWFATEPGIKLVNAYGLTETSDDTNHEVMERAPDGARVPLGRAIHNVHVYVVDEHLSLVPLGAPGEIVFSGVCVGRGYVNDPERTRLAFLRDPHREGERLYRSGDYGCWRPDGKLEFLGRRDAQVKIRGFRIEIGEIENRLSRVSGVRRGAVVVAERTDGSKQLVAFYSGPRRLEVDALQDRLGRSLPEYMVPSVFHWRKDLPLTENGKIDRKVLRTLARELESVAEKDVQSPRTAAERRLAAAWAQVLGVSPDQIGRRDHFFDRGGTSLSAVKLVIAVDRAVSLKDVTRHPVLADQARLIDAGSGRSAGLLQSLTESDGDERGALVCFPYAGGNAVSFRPLARALRESGLAVWAVELPGHDVAAERESLASMEQVVDGVVAEILRLGPRQVLLWGHSSGAAFALEAARRLQDRDVQVAHVFLGAQLPGDAAARRASVAALTGRSDADIAAGLSGDDGHAGLDELDPERVEHVGATYRHDCVSAHRYLIDALESPPTVKVSAPVTVVGAADDPATEDLRRRYRDWRILAEQVDLYLLDDGGHHFLRTRPTEAAQLVLHVAERLTSREPARKGDRDVISRATA